MNKSYLIAGGSSAVSLAIGGAAGYLVARKRFNATLDEKIKVEVEATVKHYSLLLMQARDKPESPADIATPDDEDNIYAEPTLTDEDQAVIEKGRQTLGRAKAALIDYQGYAEKPSLDQVVKNNIFASTTAPKKALPPRDPATGHFLPKNGNAVEETPYLISHDNFLAQTNEDEVDFSHHDQENLKYFVNDKTLLGYDPENPIEIGVVGEVNLTLFPNVPEGEPSIICVRNEGLQMDYEIQLVEESLTEYMGFGESDADLPDDEEDEGPEFEDLDSEQQADVIRRRVR